MNKYEVTLKDNGAKLMEYQVLYDSEGNPVKTSKHSRAIGIGDTKGDMALYRSRVKALLETAYGTNLANIVSNNAALLVAKQALEMDLSIEIAAKQQEQRANVALMLEKEGVLHSLTEAHERIRDLEVDLANEKARAQAEATSLREEIAFVTDELREAEADLNQALDALEALQSAREVPGDPTPI